MRLPTRMNLPDLSPIRGKVPQELERFIESLFRTLQDYNRRLVDAVSANTKSGVLIIDDGTNRATLTFTEGKLTATAIAVSSAQTMTWTNS